MQFVIRKYYLPGKGKRKGCNAVFDNYGFYEMERDIAYRYLKAKQQFWNNVLKFKDCSFIEILKDLKFNIRYEEILIDKVVNDVIFKKGTTIDFGLGRKSDPKIKDYIEGRTNKLVLYIKEKK